MVIGYFETSVYSTVARHDNWYFSWDSNRTPPGDKQGVTDGRNEIRNFEGYYHYISSVHDNASFTDTYKQEKDSLTFAQAAIFLTTCLSGSEQFKSRPEHPTPDQCLLHFFSVSKEILIVTQIRSIPLPSQSFPINYSLMMELIDVTVTEIVVK